MVQWFMIKPHNKIFGMFLLFPYFFAKQNIQHFDFTSLESPIGWCIHLIVKKINYDLTKFKNFEKTAKRK